MRPGRKKSYSAFCGSLTLTMRSARCQTSAALPRIDAPASAYSWSARELPSPACSSTRTSWPASRRAVTPLGTRPTRVSLSLISLGTPIIMCRFSEVQVNTTTLWEGWGVAFVKSTGTYSWYASVAGDGVLRGGDGCAGGGSAGDCRRFDPRRETVRSGAVHQVPRGQRARRQGGAQPGARGESRLHARASDVGDVESRAHHVGRDGGGENRDAPTDSARRRRPVRVLLLRPVLRQARRGGKRQGDVREQAVGHLSRYYRVARRRGAPSREMGVAGRSDSAGTADVEPQFSDAPGFCAPWDAMAGVDRRRVERHPGIPSFAAGDQSP